jgi:predicted RNA-binding Zn ribbon-like protein
MPFVAGVAALDFVNTAEERGHAAAGDALVTAADLRLWGERYGILAGSGRRETGAGAELGRAREARELLYDIFFARVHDGPVAYRQLTRLTKLAADAYSAAALHVEDDAGVHWRWSPSELTSVRHVAVVSAVELLRSEPSPRLKQCPGDHCGWFFLDATKQGNRRWCRMSECGQEAKDERRRARRRSGGLPG